MKPLSVLIVDDHLTNLKLLRAQLESEGHTVFEAHDGVDALALLERQRVDGVISDILMPRMDGYRLCSEIRKHARLHDLPIIIYSATYTAAEDEKLALDMGADKYLKKPASVATLVAALLEAIAIPHAARQPKALQEVEVLKEYSERLVSKLEEKNTELQAQQALRESAEKLRLFADNVPAMTAAFDENLRLQFVNKRYAEFFGHGKTNLLGKHLREVVGEKVYRKIEGYFVQVLRGHPVTYQRTRKLPNGESGYLEIKLLPHIGEQGKVLGCFAVTTDITEHKLVEERIQRVAHHDSLTGLPNRLLFNDRLQQAINLAKRDARQFALLYLDLDRFKPVNDTLGHTAGDQLLQAVASRIRCEVRESDTVARIGGDEFTVILSNITKREEAEIVARKIIAAFAAPFRLGSQQQSVEIGTSIGISIYPTDGQDADALVNAADAAMYSAKQVGNSFRFYAA